MLKVQVLIVLVTLVLAHTPRYSRTRPNLSETSMTQDAPIYLVDVLGIGDTEISDYSVRFSSNRGFHMSVMDAYYMEHDALVRHISTRRWTDPTKRNRRHNIPASKVIQLVELSEGGRGRWLFVGVFHVGGIISSIDGGESYEMVEDERFAKFDARVVVDYQRPLFQGQLDYPLAGRSYSASVREGLVIHHVSSSRISALPFPGFEKVRLTYAQLRAVVNEAEWETALASVQAVYLQTDRLTGWHYVGSAYSQRGNERGLLSRWQEYVGGDHTGGNARLKSLSPEYIEENFEYSILEIFDMHASPRDIIHREHWWMDTLSSVYRTSTSHPHGYNSVRERERDEPKL